MALNQRITIQYNNGMTDRVRGQTKNLADLCTVSAEVESLKAEVQVMAAQRGAFISHRFKARYKPLMPLVQSTCPGKPLKILYGGRSFDVITVQELDERKGFVELTARESP